MGRKLLALILASVVWWLVSKNITAEADVRFVVRETQSKGLADHGTLEIRPPIGWQLSTPTPGSDVRFWFKGPSARLDQFLENGPSAHFEPSAGFNNAGSSVQKEVRASDLVWREPEAAMALLREVGAEQTVLQLNFERRVKKRIDISSNLISINGVPAEGHRKLDQHLDLSASYILLTGPSSKIDELLQRIELWKQGSAPAPKILESLDIEGARSDVRHPLALHPSQARNGITMVPEMVEAFLPIRLKSLEPVSFVLNQVSTLGSAPEGLWDSHYTPRTWIAELAYHPDLSGIEFSGAWVKNHLVLYLSLSELPSSAQEYDLRVHWALVNIDSREQEELLLKSLTVRSEQNGEDTVRMTRTENQQ
jgi:hypothetical protein